MCDDRTEAQGDAYLKDKAFSRRHFGALATAIGLSVSFAGCSGQANTSEQGASAGSEKPAMTPTGPNLVSRDVVVPTPDGNADAYFVHPADGKHAAVIIWPDIRGLRPAFKLMAERLAGEGYSVLVVNPFFRSLSAAEVENAVNTLSFDEVRPMLFAMGGTTDANTNASDTQAFVKWVDAQPSVDTSRQIGVMGYCYGGPVTLNAAAAMPSRIGAAGSFHGGRLVTDQPNSPHLKIPKMEASFLIAIAENDDEKEPEVKTVLREAFTAAGQQAEIEVYAGAQHGWCPPDSRVYNQEQAEKAWSRMLAIFGPALA